MLVCYEQLSIPNWLYNVPVIDLVCLTCLWQRMTKIMFKKISKIVIVVVKSYCCILVFTVMVTVWRNYSAVTNAVARVNDCWPVVILNAVVTSSSKFLVFKNIFGYFRSLDFEFNVILMFVGKEVFFYLIDISLEKLSKVFLFLSFLLFFVSKSPHLTVFN